MKICEFCGTANNDDAVKCSSCGSNSFKHKCNNCGTEFNEGNFCPKCGVKAGQEERVCPKCNTKYFSAACPTCGYIPVATPQSTQAPINKYNYQTQPTPVQSQQKDLTWLWVLGWIFFFPVPLTILIVRNKKLSTKAKIAILVAIYATIILLGLIFGEREDGSKVFEPSPTQYTESIQK